MGAQLAHQNPRLTRVTGAAAGRGRRSDTRSASGTLGSETSASGMQPAVTGSPVQLLALKQR